MFPIENNGVSGSGGSQKKVSKLGRTLAFDTETGRFVIQKGEPADRENDAAKVRQWLELVLRLNPGRYPIYPDNLGVDKAGLLGLRQVSQGFVDSELRREIRESCALCPLIQAVEHFDFRREGSRLEISFTVSLNNGESEEVEIVV